MTILATYYASAPATEMQLFTLVIRNPAAATRYLCMGFENVTARLETGEWVTFTGCGIDAAMPKRDSSGNQVLSFAIDNVTNFARPEIQAAIDAGEEVTLEARIYLMSNLSAPAKLAMVMPVVGGSFKDPTLQVEAMLHDMLNTGFPRQRYTALTAPGLRHAA